MKIPTVWKMRVHATGGTKEPEQIYPFLREHGLLGIGWALERSPMDEEDAIRLAEKEYSEKQPHGVGNVKRFVKDMQIGDLVWIRYKSLFVLYQIVSNWEYKHGGDWDTYDIHFTRKANIIYETSEPPLGPIFSALLGRQQTIARFQKLKELITAYSLWLCKRYSEGNCPPPSAINLHATRLLDLFPPEELEDIIAMFLQTERDLVLIPSSRTHANNTADYEYILVNKQGTPYYVQVKTTGTCVQAVHDQQNWILFSRDNYPQMRKLCKNANVIDPDTIEKFLLDNEKLMPTKIGALMHLFDELKSEP